MALTNFSDLKSAIATWLRRTGETTFASSTEDFIALAEADIRRRLTTTQTETNATLSLSAGTATVSLPSDYNGWRSAVLQTDPVRAIDYLAPDKLAQEFNTNASGYPRAFTIISNSTLKVAPTPDAAYDIEFLYYLMVPNLSDEAPTNWLLTGYPDVYLYGALVQAEPFIQRATLLPVWKQKYEEAIASLNDQSARQRTSTKLAMRANVQERHPWR